MTTYAPSCTSKRAGNKRAPILNLCMTPHNLAEPHHLTPPVGGKSTKKEPTLGRCKPRLGLRNFPRAIIFQSEIWLSEFSTKRSEGYRERASDEFWGRPPPDFAKTQKRADAAQTIK